jgi:hypothetical protein
MFGVYAGKGFMKHASAYATDIKQVLKSHVFVSDASQITIICRSNPTCGALTLCFARLSCLDPHVFLSSHLISP